MAGDTPIAKTDPLASINSIIGMFSGKTQTSTESPSTTTSTTKSNMTAAELQSQIDMAMAPLAQASHGAGLSTYSDSNLALGRAQIAADTLAKNAGNTTTQTSSGRSSTTVTPGALSSGQIGSTLKGLAATQLLAPVSKKVLSPLSDKLSNTISTGLDSIGTSIMGAISPASASEAATANLYNVGSGITDSITGDMFSSGALDLTSALPTDAFGSILSADTGSVADSITSGASGVLDTVSGVVSDAGDFLKDLFSWADGGMVGSRQSYAQGGNIDRFPGITNLEKGSDASAVLSANGEIAPPAPPEPDVVPKTNPISAAAVSSGSGKGNLSVGESAALKATEAMYGVAATPDISLGNTLMSTPGISTIGTIAKVLGVKSIPDSIQTTLAKYAYDSISAEIGRASLESNTLAGNDISGSQVMAAVKDRADPIGAFADTYDATRPIGGSGGGGGGNYSGTGQMGANSVSGGFGGGAGDSGSDGGTASAADGGNMIGPGTGTSDSFTANVSNGERVITAKTNSAIEEAYPGFFHMLEQKFNPSAAASQVAKGRA